MPSAATTPPRLRPLARPKRPVFKSPPPPSPPPPLMASTPTTTAAPAPAAPPPAAAVVVQNTRPRAGGTSTTTQVGEFRGSKLSARGSFRGEGALARTKSVSTLALLGSTTVSMSTTESSSSSNGNGGSGGGSKSASRQTHFQGRRQGHGVEVRPQFFSARGRTHNPRRAALGHFLELQQERLRRFRQFAEAGSWEKVHVGHFDWWMFPIEDGSKAEYNVFSGDVEELKALAAPLSPSSLSSSLSSSSSAGQSWLEGYLEAVDVVARAWGWDLRRARPVQPLEEGMGWTFWDIRLAKVLRSLWIFGQRAALLSMQKFARQVKPDGGLRYGRICLDEVYFMVLRERKEQSPQGGEAQGAHEGAEQSQDQRQQQQRRGEGGGEASNSSGDGDGNGDDDDRGEVKERCQ